MPSPTHWPSASRQMKEPIPRLSGMLHECGGWLRIWTNDAIGDFDSRRFLEFAERGVVLVDVGPFRQRRAVGTPPRLAVGWIRGQTDQFDRHAVRKRGVPGRFSAGGLALLSPRPVPGSPVDGAGWRVTSEQIRPTSGHRHEGLETPATRAGRYEREMFRPEAWRFSLKMTKGLPRCQRPPKRTAGECRRSCGPGGRVLRRSRAGCRRPRRRRPATPGRRESLARSSQKSGWVKSTASRNRPRAKSHRSRWRMWAHSCNKTARSVCGGLVCTIASGKTIVGRSTPSATALAISRRSTKSRGSRRRVARRRPTIPPSTIRPAGFARRQSQRRRRPRPSKATGRPARPRPDRPRPPVRSTSSAAAATAAR